MIPIPDLKPVYVQHLAGRAVGTDPPDPGAAGVQPPTPTPDPAAQQEHSGMPEGM